MYEANVIADSISPEGHRITTVKVIYPHAVHKDMLRHRCMNRNVESFRAQPPEKLIEALRNGHAFKPDVFAQRVKGMGQSAYAAKEADVAAAMWEEHIELSCRMAEQYIKMDIAKQQVNFVLQDLCPLTEIITATDWSNFYALRTEVKEDGTPVARPEVYKTAVAIRNAIESSLPTLLEHGQLHLPMVTERELERLYNDSHANDPLGPSDKFWTYVSAGRCAKISYGDYEWWLEDHDISHGRAARILGHGHMSPFEQQARAWTLDRWTAVKFLQDQVAMTLHDLEYVDVQRQLEYSGNLRGWTPARKMLPNEHDYSLMKKTVVV